MTRTKEEIALYKANYYQTKRNSKDYIEKERKRQRKVYEANKEHIKKRQHKYNLLHKEENKARKKAYLKTPAGKIVAEAGRAKAKIKRKIKFSKTWFSCRYFRLKKNAKKRGIKFDLSLNDFIEIRKITTCLYCSRTADELITKKNNIRKEVMTTERIDNSLGYSQSNCVSACYDCNRIRGDRFSYNEMLKIGETIKGLYTLRKKA